MHGGRYMIEHAFGELEYEERTPVSHRRKQRRQDGDLAVIRDGIWWWEMVWSATYRDFLKLHHVARTS